VLDALSRRLAALGCTVLDYAADASLPQTVTHVLYLTPVPKRTVKTLVALCRGLWLLSAVRVLAELEAGRIEGLEERVEAADHKFIAAYKESAATTSFVAPGAPRLWRLTSPNDLPWYQLFGPASSLGVVGRAHMVIAPAVLALLAELGVQSDTPPRSTSGTDRYTGIVVCDGLKTHPLLTALRRRAAKGETVRMLTHDAVFEMVSNPFISADSLLEDFSL
jgi:hypothetical protein